MPRFRVLDITLYVACLIALVACLVLKAVSNAPVFDYGVGISMVYMALRASASIFLD